MAKNLNLPGGQTVAGALGNVVSNTYPFGYILDGTTGLTTQERVAKALESAKIQQEVLEAITTTSWPNSITNNDEYGTYKAFLPPILISPVIGAKNASDSSGGGLYGTNFTAADGTTYDRNSVDSSKVEIIKDKYGQYEWKDWTGQKLPNADNLVKTEDRFKLHKETLTNVQLLNDRYSMRDFALIFNDTRTDYFRFGLQTIDNAYPIENPENGNSTLRLDNFKGTPWEQQDPVFYGFDIVFDAVSSPLLNGSILDFIANYSGVNEIASRSLVYDEFINQFTKFFRTNAKPRTYSPDAIAFTKNKPHFTGYADSVSNFANLDENTKLFRPGKSAYLAHYIKKITNLDLLIEANKGDTFKYTADWKKDMISITTTEDITLSMGALAHLYKLLYWSRPHGKHLIPENLLRFNCEIIVSEVRNMNRVRKNIQTGNIEVLKDDCARWVFSLRDCQFYFDKLPVENDVDLGSEPKMYEGFTFNIDFKYSTQRLERFVPSGDWGNYLGYDAGSIWKIGNSATDGNRTATSSMAPNPVFIKTGNTFNENGVTTPYVVNVYGDVTSERISFFNRGTSTTDTNSNAPSVSLDTLKNNTTDQELKSKEDAADLDAINATKDLKPGQKVVNFLQSKGVKRAKDLASDITGINATSLKSKAISTIRNSNFFDINGSLGGNPQNKSKGNLGDIKTKFSEEKQSVKTTTVSNLQQSLLNNTLNKIYNTPAKSPKKATSNPPASTSFFDIKGQLKDFLGGPLGDKVTE